MKLTFIRSRKVAAYTRFYSSLLLTLFITAEKLNMQHLRWQCLTLLMWSVVMTTIRNAQLQVWKPHSLAEVLGFTLSPPNTHFHSNRESYLLYCYIYLCLHSSLLTGMYLFYVVFTKISTPPITFHRHSKENCPLSEPTLQPAGTYSARLCLKL